MARKIIQVTSARIADESIAVVALANDGTVWTRVLVSGEDPAAGPWVQLPEIPDQGLSEDFMKDPILG